MKFPQKLIGVKGYPCQIVIQEFNSKQESISIESIPDSLKLLAKIEKEDKAIFQLQAISIQRDYQILRFKYTTKVKPPLLLNSDKNDEWVDREQEYNLLYKIFDENEFFLCLILQSNVHIGWEPSWEQQFLGPEPGWKLRKRFGKEGNNAFGHSFKHVLNIEKIYHDRNIPVTWLIDPYVAGENAKRFIDWHYTYGDDYGLLPTSYFYYNELNFNMKKSKEDTLNTLSSAKRRLERVFINNKYPVYSNYCGIDQWVGSIGTNWIHAAYQIGYEGIWGMGWDHISCDTSMFHRGAPWSVYKPSLNFDYRIPIQDNEMSKLWAYQWTHRDLTNSLHYSGPHKYGSTRFSTDPDDVRSNKITQQLQPHYFTAMLNEYKKNLNHPSHRMMEFIVHQEDHDSVHKESNEYLDLFMQSIFDKKETENITIATLEEITQYLNIIYGPDESTEYFLNFGDPITIHSKIKPGGTKAPKDWPKSPGEKYPTTLCYYGKDSLWLGYYPKRIPVQFYDYEKHANVKENGSYPLEKMPKITIDDEHFNIDEQNVTYTACIQSNRDFKRLPLFLWKIDIPKDIIDNLEMRKQERLTFELYSNEAYVKILDIQKGNNNISFKI